MSKGLEALERLMANYYEMCRDAGDNDDQYQRYNLTSERAIIEKELKAFEIIKDFVWTENGEMRIGLCGDVEITLGEDDFESKEKYDLLKEALN